MDVLPEKAGLIRICFTVGRIGQNSFKSGWDRSEFIGSGQSLVKIPLGEGGTSHYCFIKGGKDWSQLLLAKVESGRTD